MTKLEYIYLQDGIVNVLQVKASANRKIGVGYILQTYHFSINQVMDIDLKQDNRTCLDCPLSFNMNNGITGGCYTHKGLQRLGLNSMLKRLNKLFVSDIFGELNYNKVNFDTFIYKVSNTVDLDLIRFGAYGESIHLSKYVIENLVSLSKNFTGYTHQYKDDKYQFANNYFMASVHNNNDLDLAKKNNFRSFIAKSKDMQVKGVNCPASKESNKNLSCIKCKLCNGNNTGTKKDVYINIH